MVEAKLNFKCCGRKLKCHSGPLSPFIDDLWYHRVSDTLEPCYRREKLCGEQNDATNWQNGIWICRECLIKSGLQW